jgi:hypothetical protein
VLRESYPAVDIDAQLREARAWCVTNATKRKTADGMPKFLNRWMAREQNEPQNHQGPPARAAPERRNEPKGYQAMRQLAQAGGFDDGKQG